MERSRGSRSRAQAAPYLLLAPFLILFLGLWVFPLFYSFYLSLTEFKTAQEPVFIGLANYANLFADKRFHGAVWNTLFMMVMYEVMMVVAAFGLALLLHERVKRGRNLFSTVLFSPLVVSLIVTAIVFDLLLNTNFGLVNQLLGRVGISPIGWLTNPDWAKWSVTVMRLWRVTGYYTIVFLGALQSLPGEVLEAATVDGASGLQRIRYMTIPLMRPVIAFVVVMSTTYALQLFEEPWVLTAGGPMRSTETMLIYLYWVTFRKFNIGYGAAISYVLTAIMVLVSVINIRLIGLGESSQ
ncbi:MAG TPA: sugar ABC transporter permease [Anaerolineae bacterium]|nr:sugar ABC transporter permease [Anaerolineae bacterium]